jgi:hypothetical protein
MHTYNGRLMLTYNGWTPDRIPAERATNPVVLGRRSDEVADKSQHNEKGFYPITHVNYIANTAPMRSGSGTNVVDLSFINTEEWRPLVKRSAYWEVVSTCST